ncbi:MAG: cyclophilin-like fold protein [Nitrososphaerota archaeon]
MPYVIMLNFSSGVKVMCELIDEPELEKIIEFSPFRTEVERWGDEIYFELPVRLKLKGDKTLMEIGEVAYWPEGNSLCIFFGPTPISRDERPVAYSKVKPLGVVVEGIERLKKVNSGELVEVSLRRK